mmetsp:Transcript_12771/g.19222  ORF Transcript_12771/g.19222 Transcript_12771/m.19222 type:complete len:243 (-) Transcript_12771:243-971(-)
MAHDKKKTATVLPRNVLAYIPNIIGYLRVFLTLSSITLMICSPRNHWEVAIVAYVSSFVGDLFDGMAARKFDQCSAFGGLLDMVTDRCSTAGLLCVLSREYGDEPFLVLLFTMLILLDISSHWCQMYSTTSLQQHHKSADGNKGRFFLVRWYYSSYPFFGYCCVGAEFTYIALYVLARVNNDASLDNDGGYDNNNAGTLKMLVEYFLMASVPACAVKQVVNVSQLCSSCYAVAKHDAMQKNK